MADGEGLYIALISLHGLIRGEELELGRDADTGGQVQYVLDLARTLAEHPDVGRVELMTRQILSTNVDHQYGEHLEQITDQAWIVRLPFGPHRYLYKESLWPYLPQFVDNALVHFREIGRVPDVVHSHYADAGEAGVRLARLTSAPLVHTGHSLGRVKQQRLLDKGLSQEVIEERYHMSRRIEAEEGVIRRAGLIITSTKQEVDEQYGMYAAVDRSRMAVIPPGVDLGRFRPPRRGERFEVAQVIDRFLERPKKPMILAVQRPDERKNLETLIRAYGESDALRELANLVLLIGARDDIDTVPKGQRKVLQQMLRLIDRYDLYGSVAYPKQHSSEDIAEVYRLAAARGGVFVNPALTEPFGLTLIEAAASGLPIVATNDGGPQEIVRICSNGVLIDPLDADALAEGLLEVLSDRHQWRLKARAGIRGADRNFSWKGHVAQYLKRIKPLQRKRRKTTAVPRAQMALADRLLVCDIDNTLIGDREALAEFLSWLDAHRHRVAFGVATGRVLERTLTVLEEWNVPRPDVLISSVGSEIHYGRPDLVADRNWKPTIDYRWDPVSLRECLAEVPGIRLQPERDQREFKLSYFVDTLEWPGAREIRKRLKERGVSASLIYSHHEFLDLLPVRASKGRAIQYLARRWGFEMDEVLVAGDSGNDADMLRSGALGVVVRNHSSELRYLRGRDRICFTEWPYAHGILEGIDRHGFLPKEPPTLDAEGSVIIDEGGRPGTELESV
jgi:sucrose-phosphate synthase